jgi:transketolase
MPKLSRFKNKEDYNKWYREYREKNADKLRDYKKKYNKAWRHKNGYKTEIKYAKNNPQKIHAHRDLNNLIISKNIKKPNCVVCKSSNVQAHHVDYTKHYDVIWLCPICHRQLHLGKLSVDNSMAVSYEGVKNG